MDVLSAACRTVLGRRIAQITPLHGGDLSEVFQITLADGSRLVAKRGPLASREARMLEAIAAVRVPAPQVLGVSGDVLLLEALDEARPTPELWSRFGADLARLHAAAGDGYGWPEDYAFGPVAIANAPLPRWPDFWAERRLLPFTPHLPADLATRIQALARRLGDLLPSDPLPGLLHGDLWTGNLLPTARAIYLIDPASYYGDGEVDLAMLHLFGGPGPGFTESYGPLAPGWRERRAVYTLFPALVHLRLFGDGYRGMVERVLTAAGA